MTKLKQCKICFRKSEKDICDTCEKNEEYDKITNVEEYINKDEVIKIIDSLVDSMVAMANKLKEKYPDIPKEMIRTIVEYAIIDIGIQFEYEGYYKFGQKFNEMFR